MDKGRPAGLKPRSARLALRGVADVLAVDRSGCGHRVDRLPLVGKHLLLMRPLLERRRGALALFDLERMPIFQLRIYLASRASVLAWLWVNTSFRP